MSGDRGDESVNQEARDVSRMGDRGSRRIGGEAHERGLGRQARGDPTSRDVDARPGETP